MKLTALMNAFQGASTPQPMRKKSAQVARHVAAAALLRACAWRAVWKSIAADGDANTQNIDSGCIYHNGAGPAVDCVCTVCSLHCVRSAHAAGPVSVLTVVAGEGGSTADSHCPSCKAASLCDMPTNWWINEDSPSVV